MHGEAGRALDVSPQASYTLDLRGKGRGQRCEPQGLYEDDWTVAFIARTHLRLNLRLHKRKDRFVQTARDPVKMIVYKITCTISGKAYIGMTKRSLHARWRAHRSKGSGCWGLKGAIKKYGVAAFKTEVLAEGLSDATAATVEKEMIHVHGTKAPHGYNLTEGGQGSAHHNPHHGENIAKAWQRPESRAKHMAWRTPERMKEMTNSDGQWKEQQRAWAAKRLERARAMPKDKALEWIDHTIKRNVQHAKRKGRSSERIAFVQQMGYEVMSALLLTSQGPLASSASSSGAGPSSQTQSDSEFGHGGMDSDSE